MMGASRRSKVLGGGFFLCVNQVMCDHVDHASPMSPAVGASNKELNNDDNTGCITGFFWGMGGESRGQ